VSACAPLASQPSRPPLIFSSRRHQRGELSTKAYLGDLRRCRQMACESSACLRYDEDATFEGKVYFAANHLAETILAAEEYVELGLKIY